VSSNNVGEVKEEREQQSPMHQFSVAGGNTVQLKGIYTYLILFI
jgi:hypothetical protein